MRRLAPSLHSDMSSADLVVLKGDLNRRRLLGDRVWEEECATGLARSAMTCFGRAPVLAMATQVRGFYSILLKESSSLATTIFLVRRVPSTLAFPGRKRQSWPRRTRTGCTVGPTPSYSFASLIDLHRSFLLITFLIKGVVQAFL